MNSTKAESEFVVEEKSRHVDLSTENSSGTALATVQYGMHCCSYFGHEGHTADRCFRNPGSKLYKKEIKHELGKGNKQRTKTNYVKPTKRNLRGSETIHELANVAMMSNSVLRGEVDLSLEMKEKWMVDSASTSHMGNNPKKLETLQ